MKFIKSILIGLLLRAAMLLVGIVFAIAVKARMVWKGYANKSKHH